MQKYTFPNLDSYDNASRTENERIRHVEAERLSAVFQIDSGRTQEYIQRLAQDAVSEISKLDPSRSKELLGVFVSEMFRSITEQEQREERRQRQAEGIAAAKAAGKRFGRSTAPLPENFHEAHQAWREGKMILRDAAESCGMAKSTFRDAVLRVEASG